MAIATSSTRRSFIQHAAAASAVGVGMATLPDLAQAAAPFARIQGPGVYRYNLGGFELTALYDGIWYSPIKDGFVRNAGRRAVNRALTRAFLMPDVLPISITALLVNTGTKLVLIDTGSAGQITDTAGLMSANLAAAGIAPDAVDVVVISHFHPDHINGIKTKDGDKVFTKAEIMVPEPEWAFWMNDANLARASGTVHKYFLNAGRIFKDIAGEVHRYKPGAELLPGIVSIPAYGHTPGHTAFALHSNGKSMLVMSDTVRNPYLFARHPDWQPTFDMDGALAVRSRRRMLDRAAADRMLVSAYHFPFPACGHLTRAGSGYELVPVMWAPQP